MTQLRRESWLLFIEWDSHPTHAPRRFRLLQKGLLTAGSVWDAVFLTTAELVVRYQFVGGKRLAGHSVTCANALHYLFRTATAASTRLYCLLEAVEWTTSFLDRERARPALRDYDLLSLESVEIAKEKDEALDEIFSLLPPRRFAAMHRPGFDDVDLAMKKTLAWIREHRDPSRFFQRAMWLMVYQIHARSSRLQISDGSF